MTDTARLLPVLLALAIVGSSVGTVGALSPATPIGTDAAVDRSASGPVAFQQGPPSGPVGIQHTDPAEAGEGDGGGDGSGEAGDLTAVRRWLGDRIGTLLVACARQSRANGNGTCEQLAEEYPSLAGRYAAVAEETADSDDNNVSRVLNRTGENQREFATAVRNYRRALEAYRNADDVSDERRRSLARNVSRYGSRVGELGTDLTTSHEVIAENSTIDVGPARDITTDVTTIVNRTTDEVRTREFVPPELTVSATTREVSFADPTVVRGQLRAEDGTPLANRTVEVRTPERTIRTTTDAAGEYTVTYRPTTAPVGAATVEAAYRPRNDSQYLRTTAGTDVTVRATTGAVELNGTPSGVAYGDDVTVRGSVRANGTGAAGVPVTVTLGGVLLAETTTTDSGAFSASESLPASIPAGSPMLRVAVPQEDRAFAADPAAANVTVTRSTPTLVVNTERLDADTARVFGGMFVGQNPVSDARLTVRRGGETVETVAVSDEGTFETTVSVPDVAANESTALTVAYDPPQGNVEGVELRVGVGSASTGLVPDVGFVSGFGNPVDELEFESVRSADPVLLGGGLVAFLVVFVVASSGVLRRVWRAVVRGLPAAVGPLLGGGYAASRPDTVLRPPDGTDDSETDDDAADEAGALLGAATERLSGGRADESIIGAYGAVRRHLDARFGVEPALTHWELLRRYGGSLDAERRDALERLTEAYERAAFSPARSTTETAQDAIDSASVVVGERVEPGSAGD